jgi:hypothetical protein
LKYLIFLFFITRELRAYLSLGVYFNEKIRDSEVEGKGRGFIATGHIPRGETLVIEHPFAVGKAANIPQLIKKVLQSNVALCCAKDFKIRKSELAGKKLCRRVII